MLNNDVQNRKRQQQDVALYHLQLANSTDEHLQNKYYVHEDLQKVFVLFLEHVESHHKHLHLIVNTRCYRIQIWILVAICFYGIRGILNVVSSDEEIEDIVNDDVANPKEDVIHIPTPLEIVIFRMKLKQQKKLEKKGVIVLILWK